MKFENLSAVTVRDSNVVARFFGLLFISYWLCFCPASASTVLLPAANVTVTAGQYCSSCFDSSLSGPPPLSITTKVTAQSAASASASAGAPDLIAKVYAPDASATAGAREDYYFLISSPQQVTNIPVTFSGILGVGLSNPRVPSSSFANADARVSSLGQVLGSAIACSAGAGNCSGLPQNATSQVFVESLAQEDNFANKVYFQFSELLSLNSGQVYGVTMDAGINAFQQLAYASSDPFFQIDPVFLANNPGLTFQFSDGIENALASSVPEPSAWTMMLFGFCAVAFMTYRRKGRASWASILAADFL